MMLLSDTTWKAIIYQQKYNICFAYEVNTRCRRWRAEQTFAHWLSQHNPAPSNTDSSADGPVSMNWQPCTTRTFQHPRYSWESRKQSDPEPWRHKANVKSSLTAHTYSRTPCWKIWLTHFGFLSFFFKSSAALLNQARGLFTPNTLWRLRGRYRGCCACVGTLDNPVTLTGQLPSFLFCQEYILWQDAITITRTKVKAHVFRLS